MTSALDRAVRELEDQGWATVPVTPRVQQEYDELTDHARWFFGLPDSEKSAFDIRKSSGHRGWVPRDEAGAYDDEGERRYEAFDIGRTPMADDRDHHRLRGFNRWPTSRRGSAMANCGHRMFERMSALSNLIGDAICDRLEIPHAAFRRFRREPVSQLRLIHYLDPSTPDPVIDLTSDATPAMGGHTDYEFFTLLFQSEPGTQVLDRSGDWHEVPHRGVVTLMAGDMLEVFSSERFSSTYHRAAPGVRGGRVSIPFFAGADFSARVRGTDRDHDAVHFGRHLMQQLRRDFPYLRDEAIDLTDEGDQRSSFEQQALRRAQSQGDRQTPH